MPLTERVWVSLFQSVTPRTAGFNTADLTLLSEVGQMLIIMLMLIGGSPGSTAGGMKTTTLAVLVSSALSVFRKKGTHPFFSADKFRMALSEMQLRFFLMYIVLFLVGGMVISRTEDIPLMTALFETASAIGTVGLSLGITPELGLVSHIILICLMFFGRVGGLTLIFATISEKKPNGSKISSGKYHSRLKENKKMKSILLIGLGRFGRHIAIKLDELHHQVMAVDKEDTRVNAVLPFVTNAQIGDATNEDFLSSLGVGNFDVCIVAIGDNFQNSLEVTSLLKELGARMVVSRAARDVHAKFLLRNGADEIVYPERQLADWVAIRYSADHIFDYIELDEEHAIFEISIPEEWIGKTIGQLDIRKKYDINIMALKNK